MTVEPPTEARSAVMVVHDALKHTILHGSLSGGERLRQDAVAAQFKVSQTIVREAFRQLVAEGLLQAEPRRGVSVPTLNAEEALETTKLRSILEAQALEWSIPNMTKADFDRMRQVLVEIDETTSVDELITLNARFHSLLYAPSNQKRTLAIIEMLRVSFERYLRYTWKETSHYEQSQREHWEILELCRRRRAPEACALLTRHIMGTGTLLVDRFRKLV